MFNSRGGVNYQMQIVTKLPNEKYPKLPTRNVQFLGGVNYQMQIVPNYWMKISKTTN